MRTPPTRVGPPLRDPLRSVSEITSAHETSGNLIKLVVFGSLRTPPTPVGPPLRVSPHSVSGIKLGRSGEKLHKPGPPLRSGPPLRIAGNLQYPCTQPHPCTMNMPGSRLRRWGCVSTVQPGWRFSARRIGGGG